MAVSGKPFSIRSTTHPKRESKYSDTELMSYVHMIRFEVIQSYKQIGFSNTSFNRLRMKIVDNLDPKESAEDFVTAATYHMRGIKLRREHVENHFVVHDEGLSCAEVGGEFNEKPGSRDYLILMMKEVIAHELAHHIRDTQTVRVVPMDLSASSSKKRSIVVSEAFATFVSKTLITNRAYNKNRFITEQQHFEAQRYRDFIIKRNLAEDLQVPPEIYEFPKVPRILGYMIGNAAALGVLGMDIKEQNTLIMRALVKTRDEPLISELASLAGGSVVIDGPSTAYFNSYMKGSGISIPTNVPLIFP